MEQVAGVVLAGGQGRRLGGIDKSLVTLGGVPLVARVLARLAPQCARLAISANGDPARYAAFGCPVLPDADGELQGPLAGVLAGLDWARREGFAALVTAATDTPFLPEDLVARLCAGASRSGLAVAAEEEAGGVLRWHPTFALWPVALRGDLRAALRQDERRMRRFAEGQGAVPVVFASGPVPPFFNINTPEDLAEAERLLAQL
ncbi:molybdenum cofactor guanylyltransferase MobA [Celeribacter indicus]|uniref:Molybdenum cofactor guanylyltransferase n=1 Tax=Celeribacter indicus TaxID=1208324 RepID=A0A0B5DPC9_9RHOB|nr:molybdenum cofactor guanylyltransferase MobA [Celeribacter indicus]AJE45448.1 molybdopterin-guanine dinucleotide biosynthesis protein MobA [Celeribacter indicus]SDX02250.1 molybdenum cofactor guanylyltransferase [Celeribacter indicus]